MAGLNRPGERGSGTVMAAALALLVMAGALAVLALAHGAASRARAQQAADLSALAAAQLVLDGGPGYDACPLAADVVARNRASLKACTVLSGERVRVEASVALRFPSFARGLEARAVAVAGPAPGS